MNQTKRLLYNAFVSSIRLYQRLFLDLRVWGRKHIPRGPKIYVQNHITSTDPYWVLPILPEPVHVIIGPGYQSKVVARVLDYFEQINAMPRHRKTVVDEAVKYLKRGESIYTAPEGYVQETLRLGRFYPGVARIYRRIQVPIIPIALLTRRSAIKEHPRFRMVVEGKVYRATAVWHGLFCINVGEPFMPELTGGEEGDESQRILDELKERIRLLLEEVRVGKFRA